MPEQKWKKRGIVFVADNWGQFEHGGIDVFNQKLCEAMGYVMNRKEAVVVCLIIGRKAIADEIFERERSRNVILVSYVPQGEDGKETICRKAVDKINSAVPDTEFVWIGHDTISGELACMMSRRRNEKSAIILHTDFFRIHADRCDDAERRSRGDDNVSKDNMQRRLVRETDYVFCVGPRLYRKFKKMKFDEPKKVFLIIPGLEERRSEGLTRLNIMISGRFYGNAIMQKNWENTCKATINALSKLADKDIDVSDFVITIYGFDPNMTEIELDIMKIAKEKELYAETGIKPAIQFKKFDQSRENYLKELGNSCLFVMGSEQESFGMVAWEALSMEVPIVISRSSGLYEYLDNELGYLLNGLCGSFAANRKETMESMTKSIASILRDIPKMDKATELLRDRMSDHTWENLAIQMAKTVGVNAVMDEMIYKNHDCFEFTYAERRLMFTRIKMSVENQEVKKRLVFFGGISRNLFWKNNELTTIDDSFCEGIVNLLDKQKNMHIYICYETGNAVKQREEQMGDELGEKTAGVLEEKARKISELHETFAKRYGEKFKSCVDRFHLVPLTKSPSVYINIVDEDWYFSLKYENRSTQNTTMKLKNGRAGSDEKRRLKEHMKFILSDNTDGACKNLIEQMEEWGKNYRYE